MKKNLELEDFCPFEFKKMWQYFKNEHLSFWMICGYLVFEFVRPHAIFPQIDIVPYAQLCILGSFVGAILDPSVRWTSSPVNKWLILFFIWIQLSSIAAYNTQIAFSNFNIFFNWVIIYFLIVNIINSKERFYIFILIYILAAGKIAIGTSKTWIMRGFSFTEWGLAGPPGYFQNSGELAVLMVMLFPLAYYFFINFRIKSSKLDKALLLVLWIAPILTTLGASSRGSQVALAGQLLLMFRKSVFKVKPLIGTILFILLLINLLPQQQKDRFTAAGDDRTSQQRLFYWKHGYTMIQEHPLLGVGYFNFASYYEQHYSYDLLYPHAQLPHNILVQIGTDAGIPALILFMLMLKFCLTSPFRFNALSQTLQNIGYGLGMGVLGYFIAGQFVTITYYPFFWIHMAFLSILHNLNSLKIREKNSELTRDSMK